METSRGDRWRPGADGRPRVPLRRNAGGLGHRLVTTRDEPTQNAAPNADTTSSTGTATTDADCVGDAHGKQPNGDNSHEFTAANMPPGKEKHCPSASVPEVPAAAGLLGLLMLVGAGFLVKTGHLRLPVTGSA